LGFCGGRVGEKGIVLVGVGVGFRYFIVIKITFDDITLPFTVRNESIFECA